MAHKTLGDDLRPRAAWEQEPLVVTSSVGNVNDEATGQLNPEARLDAAEAELVATQAKLADTETELAATKAKLATAEAKLVDQGSK
jgi:hypothetical protein